MSTAERAYQETAGRAAKESLVLDHVHLVRHVLGRVTASLPSGVDRENLEGAGLVGLVEAAERFDPAKGEFAGFAKRRIRGAMIDELRRNSQLNQSLFQRLKQIEAARQRLPAPASLEDIAAATGLSLEQVVETLEAARWTRVEQGIALEQVAGAGRPDADDEDPAQRAEHNDLLEALAAAIERLPERDRLIVTMYHLEDLRLAEIGAVLNLAAGTVSRNLAVAEHRLSEQLRALSD